MKQSIDHLPVCHVKQYFKCSGSYIVLCRYAFDMLGMRCGVLVDMTLMGLFSQICQSSFIILFIRFKYFCTSSRHIDMRCYISMSLVLAPSHLLLRLIFPFLDQTIVYTWQPAVTGIDSDGYS